METTKNNYTISKKFHCIIPDIESFSIKTIGVDIEDKIVFIKRMVTKKRTPSRSKRRILQLLVKKTKKKGRKSSAKKTMKEELV